MPYIRCRDLIKVYKTGKLEVIALRGLDMEVHRGELVVIQGPSGSGKTTLLNLLGGVDRPTAGSIGVEGVNIVDYDESALAHYRRTKVGFVFQFFNLFATFTAHENVEFSMLLAGESMREARKRASGLLKKVDMSERSGHKPDELSGGEQQRVAIAVALANDPPLILADEPTGELDTQTGLDILNLFRTLKDDFGKTVVIMTNDERISTYADQVMRIEDGQILMRPQSRA